MAMTHHLLARVQSFLGDFRAAISHEKTTFSIYQKKVSALFGSERGRNIFPRSVQLGAEHEKTKESSQCLEELTAKAVTMQKTVCPLYSESSPLK